MSAEARHLATVELLGSLTYGGLRSFQITAAAIALAPDARVADALAEFAIAEHRGYVLLRDHLRSLTDLAAAVIDRQKPAFDAYFDEIPLTDWWAACALFAVGLPLTADFIRQLAPALPGETAAVVVAALADREPFERFALGQLQRAIAGDEDLLARVRSLVADVLGRALTGFQGVTADTDALQVLLEAHAGAGEEGDALVRTMAVTVLDGHRRRMHALGLEEVD